jgi:hypothetical protein
VYLLVSGQWRAVPAIYKGRAVFLLTEGKQSGRRHIIYTRFESAEGSFTMNPLCYDNLTNYSLRIIDGGLEERPLNLNYIYKSITLASSVIVIPK